MTGLSPRRRAVFRAYGVPLTLGTAMFAPGLWYAEWAWDPGLYTAISLNAAREGHWWTLQHANTTYFNKPPLWFWVHGAFAAVLGEADWVLRLPDLLAALACVALLVSIVLRLHGPRVALIAGVGLALCSEYFRRISQFRLDIPHAALMLLAVRMVVAGVMPSPNRRAGCAVRAWPIMLAGVPIGLAMLIKPLFALYALVLMGVWMAIVSRAARRATLWLLPSAAVAALVAAPWHVSMWLIHGESFVNAYFVKQSLERATGDRFAPEPWYAYFVYLSGVPTALGRRLGGGSVSWSLAPWLACALMGVAWWVRGRVGGKKLAPRVSSAGGVLAQVWTVGFLLALSLFGDKKSWYLAPVFPGLAWIAALFIARVTPRRIGRAARTAAWPVALAALAAVLMLRPGFERPTHPPPDLSALAADLRGRPDADLWNGSLTHYDNARLYILSGRWPAFIYDSNTRTTFTVPVGALVVYDRTRQGPDPSDQVLHDDGRFVVARRTRADAAEPIARTRANR